ncbi:MAG: peptidylprolyl isomerase [Clostridiaceae bacterium]|nr:peptidylprolyl isomerase [Clostridiaceae bacterium]
MEKKAKKKMPTDIKIFTVVCIIIAIIIIAAIVYIVKPTDVAIVGDNKITSEKFSYYFSRNVQNIMMQFGYTDANTFLNMTYGTSTMGDVIKQQTLTQAVQIEVLLQEAKKEGFQPDKEKLDELWGDMEKNITESASVYGRSVNDFCKEAFGTSFNKVKQFNYDLYKAQMYMEEKIKAITVDDTELASYYEENKEAFDYSVVSHILIKCEEDAENSEVEAKEKIADDILDRVNAGEDFAALAREFSEDPGSKDSGGTYRVWKNGQFVPEFENWAFSHEVGETGIIRTAHGFHVMKMDEIINTLDAQKDDIKYAYQSQEFQKILDEKLNSEEYKFEIKDGFYEF